jgi:hypothetical protein
MKTKVSKGTGITKGRFYFGGGRIMLRLTARGILINRNMGSVLLIKYLDKHSKSPN